MGTLVLVSFGFIACGILVLLYQFSFRMRGVVVPGTVIGKEEQWVRSGSAEGRRGRRKAVVDVVSFQPRDSAKPVTLKIESAPYSHRVGSQVQVMYLPGKLGSARIKEPGRWIRPCLWIGFWLVLAAFGLAHLLGILPWGPLP